jgi:excisionase family DNA binding protein
MATARHPEDHEYLTVAEAAALLRVGPSTIWRWIKAGRLPAHRLGPRTVRIHRADVEAMEQPEAVPAPSLVPPRSMTLEEAKASIGRRASPEELARRQAWVAELLSMERPSIAPLTTADLVQMGREGVTADDADEWIRKHLGRRRVRGRKVVSD